jgi:hypothetical protein
MSGSNSSSSSSMAAAVVVAVVVVWWLWQQPCDIEIRLHKSIMLGLTPANKLIVQ